MYTVRVQYIQYPGTVYTVPIYMIHMLKAAIVKLFDRLPTGQWCWVISGDVVNDIYVKPLPQATHQETEQWDHRILNLQGELSVFAS